MATISFPEDWPTLLASQVDHSHELTRSKALLFAVLNEAIVAVCGQATVVVKEKKYRQRNKERVAAEARAWFLSDDTVPLFSFMHICYVLGLDPGWVRKQIFTESHNACKTASKSVEWKNGKKRNTVDARRGGAGAKNIAGVGAATLDKKKSA